MASCRPERIIVAALVTTLTVCPLLGCSGDRASKKANGAPTPSVESHTCLGYEATIIGTSGDDVISGTLQGDIIQGRGGDDTINGRGVTAVGPADLICGGEGNDTLVAGPGYTEFSGDGGDDVLEGSARGRNEVDFQNAPAGVTVDLSDRTATGWGSDRLERITDVKGSYFDDSITGTSAANRLDGELGDDTIVGLAGDDEIEGGAGNDVEDGGRGNDLVLFLGAAVEVDLRAGTAHGLGNDTLRSFEKVAGGASNDVIIGDDQSNVLAGDGGDDRLFGGGGNDTLLGDDDRDVLVGGEGNDRADGGRHHDQCLAERKIRCEPYTLAPAPGD